MNAKTLAESLDAAIGVAPLRRPMSPTWIERLQRDAIRAALWPVERIDGPVSYVRRRVSPAQARAVYVAVGSNACAAARILGIPRSTFRDRLRAAQPPH